MNIIPKKITYYFKVKQHTMRAVAEHAESEREISYFFDEKLVSKKTIPSGTILKDDDFIRDILEEYCNHNNGLYADLFNNHSDMVRLEMKITEVVIESFEIVINVTIREEKNRYQVILSANDGEDRVVGDIKATNFSDVLEKLRIFINTLTSMSTELSQNLDELNDDKVMERIRWQ